MNDILTLQADGFARVAGILQNGLAEAEAAVPIVNERLAALTVVGCSDMEIDGPVIFSCTAGISNAATD